MFCQVFDISMNVNDFSSDEALAQASDAFERPPRTKVIEGGDAQIPLARFIGLPFLLFDRFMIGKRGSFDAASAYYFFGRRSEQTLSDREIIRLYREMHP